MLRPVRLRDRRGVRGGVLRDIRDLHFGTGYWRRREALDVCGTELSNRPQPRLLQLVGRLPGHPRLRAVEAVPAGPNGVRREQTMRMLA